MHEKTVSEARSGLLNDIAQRLGKPRDALVPWVDYDPISIDEAARRIVSPGVRWAGD